MYRPSLRRGAAAALSLAALLMMGAATPSKAAPEQRSLDLPVHGFELDNGLRVLVAPTPGATAAAVVLAFRVGSLDEQRGRSGFAHLFEHMMFQGSTNAPKGEHSRLIDRVGGSSNAFTTYDMTAYYDVVPPEHLPLALWLESDRLRGLALTEETMRNQVDAVREELRERIENAAYAPAFLRLQELLFANWANAHPTIGDHADIEAGGVDAARAFFRRHYGPGNLVLVLSGAVEPARGRALVEHYFGGLSGPAPPARPDVSEPAPTRSAPLIERMEDRHARNPALLVAWQGPPRTHPDYYAMTVLTDILAGGDSSRLYQRMVMQERSAASVSADSEGRDGPDVVSVTALLHGADLEAPRRAIDEEVARLQRELVPEAELAKVRTRAEAAFLFGLVGALGRGQLLARLALLGEERPSTAAEYARHLAVTAEDVRRVAQRWLVPARQVVLEVVPAPPRAAPAPHTPPTTPTTAGEGGAQ